HKWVIEEDGRLFTQINQSEVLSEFLNMLVSPLEGDDLMPALQSSSTREVAKTESKDQSNASPASVSLSQAPKSSLLGSPPGQSLQQERGLLTLITKLTFATGIVVA